jgi:hypothetical protein
MAPMTIEYIPITVAALGLLGVAAALIYAQRF